MSTKDEGLTSSPNSTKPNVVRRFFGLKIIKYVKAL
jgi:hypothetical protein